MNFELKLPFKGDIFSLFVILTLLIGVSSAIPYGPSCKEECDKTFTNDDLIEHPGVKLVCHRGCELFTVAFISTPRGGVSLVGPKPGVIPPEIMASLDEYGVPLGPALFPVYKKKLAALNKSRNEVMKMNMDKAKKEKEEIERKIVQKMDNVVRVRTEPHHKEYKEYKMNLIKKIKEEKEKKQRELEELLEKTLKDENKNKKNSGSLLLKLPKKVDSQTKHKDPNAIDVKKENKLKTNVHDSISIEKNVKKITANSIAKQTIYTGEEARRIINQGRKPHGPIHKIVEKVSKPSSSKTTVQPIHHPVQDHPVHANRQITTDSSDSDDRKTTTPKSANPLVLKISPNQVHDKKTNIKDLIHPLLQISVMRPIYHGLQTSLPQQVSIIEIVKKKNNINFEKLHREHMEGAALCPMINERLEQAKQSCRHACSTAYSVQIEQDACIVGCHLRASASFNQVEAEKPRSSNNNRNADIVPFKGPSILLSKDGLFSSVTKMFSSFVDKFEGMAKKEMQTFGTDMKSSSGDRRSPHFGFEMVFQKSGPVNFGNKMSSGKIINSETVLHVITPDDLKKKSEDKTAKTKNTKQFGDMFTRTIEERFKEFEEHNKDVEKVLNKEIEIMGLHLNERPNNMMIPGYIPKFIRDIMFSSSSRFGKVSEPETKEEVFEEAVHEIFDAEAKAEKKKYEQIEITSKDFDDKNVQNYVVTDFVENYPNLSSSKETVNSNPDFMDVKYETPRISVNQLQQLDLLDCISRKSGLPRWLIGVTIFASALIVFWLCFSLSTPVDEAKLSSKRKIPPTMVFCEDHDINTLHGSIHDQKQPLMTQEKCIKIHFETV